MQKILEDFLTKSSSIKCFRRLSKKASEKSSESLLRSLSNFLRFGKICKFKNIQMTSKQRKTSKMKILCLQNKQNSHTMMNL